MFWKTNVRIFGYSFWWLASRKTQSRVLATHFGDLQSATPSHEITQNVLAIHSRLASHETPRISFLKCFFFCGKLVLKPLPSSLKPLFQYFYIKTHSIWMVFHSINISKVILNSFLWFWSLNYVLESFCALGWDFHHRGWGNLIFVKFLYGIGFFWWFALVVGSLWQKKQHVSRVDFMMFMHCFTL